MIYQQTLDWMYSQLPVFQRVGKAAYKANLDNTYAIMDLLRQPQHQFKSIHIAGTNGKGSTAHMLASIFFEAGYKTALYTSPHLRDFRERIRINGEMIPKAKVVEFIEKNRRAFDEIKPSFFEMTVGMAFRYFADEKVDIAIIETGLGGRLDSTNVLNPELSVITNIGKDHMQFLGDTLPLIAKEKAGIIKPKIPIVIGEHQQETDAVFIEKAAAMKAPLQFAEDIYKVTREGEMLLIEKDENAYLEVKSFPLKGDYQLKNICIAIAAADKMGIEKSLIIKGLENVVVNTGLEGRWQYLSNHPLTICDTAHNVDGLSLVMDQIKRMNYEKLHMVIGVVDDKELDGLLELFPKDAHYYFCEANIPRALAGEKLYEQASKFGLRGGVYPSVQEALKQAQKLAANKDMVFVGGSTFTVAEVV